MDKSLISEFGTAALRHIITAAGPVLIARGIATSDAEELGCALLTVAGLSWSMWRKYARAKAGSSAATPPASAATLTLLLAGLFLAAGCTTNVPGRTVASVATAVDGSMQGWGTYVALGRATPEQEAQVRDVYGKYQAVMRTVRAAMAANPNGTPTNMSELLTALQAAAGKVDSVIVAFTGPAVQHQPK